MPSSTPSLLNRDEMMDRVVRQVGEPKGAISARFGELWLIPGSMGTASYVAEGLGNPVAVHSSPHGAGCEYSRSVARKTFTASDLRTAMEGIEHRDTDSFIDEIPAAYKPIDQVMADAESLVRVRHTLRRLVSVKGDWGYAVCRTELSVRQTRGGEVEHTV